MDGSSDALRDLAQRPIPFLDRAEGAYAHIRDTMFAAPEPETRDNIRALRTMLARSEAVIDAREAAVREIGTGDGQRISGGA